MKKAGVATKPSSERLERIAKACGKNEQCKSSMGRLAAEAMRRQFVAARHACKGKAKCIQNRIKEQNKKAAEQQKKIEKGCKGKKGT
jgi:hypothetical protein